MDFIIHSLLVLLLLTGISLFLRSAFKKTTTPANEKKYEFTENEYSK